MAKAPPPLQLALQLALRTGQRKGDLLELTWSAYDGKCIRLKQSKGSARVAIPVGPSLKGLLDCAKAELKQRSGQTDIETATILTNPKSGPWDERAFSREFKKVCDDAGVHGVTFHDLRGTVVMRLAEAGCSTPQIATVTGHSLRDVDAILDAHYFKRDSALAISAIRMLEKRTKLPTKRPTGRRKSAQSRKKTV